jgi:hypothetical protein
VHVERQSPPSVSNYCEAGRVSKKQNSQSELRTGCLEIASKRKVTYAAILKRTLFLARRALIFALRRVFCVGVS